MNILQVHAWNSGQRLVKKKMSALGVKTGCGNSLTLTFVIATIEFSLLQLGRCAGVCARTQLS